MLTMFCYLGKVEKVCKVCISKKSMYKYEKVVNVGIIKLAFTYLKLTERFERPLIDQ